MIDTSIISSSTPFAVRGLSSSSTLFLSGKDIHAYLKRLSSEQAPLHEFDFEVIKVEVDGPAKAAPAKKEREEARIEGAIQVAIGIKKEVDFSAWYTNVSPYV